MTAWLWHGSSGARSPVGRELGDRRQRERVSELLLGAATGGRRQRAALQQVAQLVCAAVPCVDAQAAGQHFQH